MKKKLTKADKKYLKKWRKQDRKGRDLSPWQMIKSLFQKK
jgi:hypothetical protein